MQDTLQSTEISRRRLLISVAASTSLATCATQSAEAAIKVAQSTVHYQTTPRDGQSCGQCIQFVAPKTCKLVDGDVTPTGWCQLWVRKSA